VHLLEHIKKVTKVFNVDRPNLRNLNELETRKQDQVKISNRFAGFENLNGRARDNIKENI
jgi:hypothetical protein